MFNRYKRNGFSRQASYDLDGVGDRRRTGFVLALLKLRTPERGIVLPTLIMVTLILMVLANVLIGTGTNSLRLANLTHSSDQALFAAQAGLATVADEYSRTQAIKGLDPVSHLVSGTLASTGTAYDVVVLKNDLLEPQKFTHPLLPSQGLELPPKTIYFLGLGYAENGPTRRAGALFKLQMGASNAGIISQRLWADNSNFTAYDSAKNSDPSKSQELNASILASYCTDLSNPLQFDLSVCQVQGGVYVAPGSTTEAGIHKDDATSVSQSGVLKEPITLEEIKLPEVAKGADPSKGDVDDEPKDPDKAAPNVYITPDEGKGSFAIRWVGDPVTKVEFLTVTDGMPGEKIGDIPVESLRKVIDETPKADDQPLFNDDAVEDTVYYGDPVSAKNITWSPDRGGFRFYNGSEYVNSSGVYDGSGLDAIIKGESPGGPGDDADDSDADLSKGAQASVPNPVNPVTLEAGWQYETVTIDSGTSLLVPGSGTTPYDSYVLVVKNLRISKGGILKLPASVEAGKSSKMTIYVTHELTIEGRDALANDTLLPPNLEVLYLGKNEVKLAGGSASYFSLTAPQATVSLSGESKDDRTSFHGCLIGREVKIHDADVYFDRATRGLGAGASTLALLNQHRL